MAKIIVTKPFVLNLGGAVQHFAAGTHEVEDTTAEHWYVKAHTEALTDEQAEAEAEAEAKAEAKAAAAAGKKKGK